MSNDADIWMPFNIGDYLKDTMNLDTTAHGAYILLIISYWVGGEPLPDDDTQLRSIAKLSPYNWKKYKRLIEKFFIVENGVWRHKRIDKELVKALKNKEDAVRRGKAGAAARYGKDLDQAKTEHSSSPSPSPSPKKKNSSKYNLKSNRYEGGNLKIKAATFVEVEAFKGSWDMDYLEKQFNDLNREKVVKYPDKAFIAFVRKHIEKNGENP